MKRSYAMLPVMTAILLSTSALAAGSGMPGDNGKPGGNGIPQVNPPPRPPNPNPPKVARAPTIDVALALAKAVDEVCKEYPLGVAVVNSEGAPILVYIPDGSRATHTYSAIRKAYTAANLKGRTSEFTGKAQQDTEFAAKVAADPNLIVYPGGIPLKVGEEIIGALGVSGAEPGGHDEECGLKALDKIKGQLQ